MIPNQADPSAYPPGATPGATPEPTGAGPGDGSAADAAARGVRRGLLGWFAFLAIGGVGLSATGHSDAAFLLAAAGLFVLAQSGEALEAIRGPSRDGMRAFVRALARAVVPVVSLMAFTGLGIAIGRTGDGPHRFAVAWCVFAAVVVLATWTTRGANACAQLFVPSAAPPTRTARLTARIAVTLLLLPVPLRVLFPDLLAVLRDSRTPLVTPPGLVAQLGGEVALALAVVGFGLRRGLRTTAARLGLAAPGSRAWAVAAIGLFAVYALNAGMERLQMLAFPASWRADQEINHLIVAHLSTRGALLLGTCAGVGEELLFRGALQPRAGLLLTSLLFACAHVQYSWYGMASIAMLGIVLGLVRARSNTTTAIAVHALYDLLAALGAHG